jgi:two-component system response regulator YesN
MMNRKHALLIVDDEPFTRQGFRFLLNWQQLGIDKIIEAANASEAIEAARLEKPGIVVTDIRMPGASGLELIERFNTLLPDVPVIIISGFSDFNYAKQALKLGVTDYLLKPINRSELEKAVHHCISRLEARPEKHNMSSVSTLSLVDNFEKLIFSLSESEAVVVAGRIEELGLSLAGFNYFQTAFIRQPDQKTSGSLNRQPIIKQNPQTRVLTAVLFLTDGITILTGAQQCASLETEAVIEQQLGQGTYANRKSIVCVISPVFNSIGQTGYQVMQTMKMAQFKSFLGKTGCSNDLIDDVQMDHQIYLSQEERRRLIHSVAMHDQATVHDILSRLLTDYQTADRVDPDVFYAGILEILVSIHRMIQEAGIKECDSRYLTQEYLHRFKHIRDLFSWLEKHIDQLSGCLNQHQANKQPSVVIQQIQNTVLNQLDKNWRLEDLGALYHYHPSYLSRLFKREEGISFSEYVMRMRIAEAQKRLMTTRHSIKSICLNVGYKDYHTFLSAFKDVVGMTPQAYRQAERLKDA